MQSLLTDTIKKYKHLCDYMEIRVEDIKKNVITIKTRDTQVRDSREAGGNVRVLIKGGWGFTSFNNLELLDEFAKKAINQAKMLGNGKSLLASVPYVVDRVKVKPLTDPRGISLKDKIEIFENYNRIILNYEKKLIKNSYVSFKEEFKRKYFANSEGTYIDQEFLDITFALTGFATKNGISQHGYVTKGSSNDFNICRGLEAEVEKACKDAITHLDIPAVKSGTYTVICDPEVAAVFAHEAFGHTCEGDKYKNEDMKKELATGRAIASKILNIYDTGLDEGCRGYLKYDDEGVKTEKTYLIKEGILTGKLHSRETAALLNELPTGSARAINYKFPPICRMRNTCIENGETAFEEMIKGIDKGLYVVKARGGTGGEMFTITPRFSFMTKKRRDYRAGKRSENNGKSF